MARVLQLREWEEIRHPHGLTADDRSALAAIPPGRLEVEELREGLSVRSRSWIGIVRLPSLEIRITPKLTGDHLGLVQLLDFTRGMDAFDRLSGRIGFQRDGDSLLDVLALLFTDEVEQILRRGLVSGYVSREDDLGFVRGRILMSAFPRNVLTQPNRIPCRFEELEADVLENQLLLATLSVLSKTVRSVELHRRVVKLRSVLEPICDWTNTDLQTARTRLVYDRLNSHYRRGHDLAWLILDGFGIDDLFAVGRLRSFAFLLDMNSLFEAFVQRLFESLSRLRDVRVRVQQTYSMVIKDAASGVSYSRVRPDLVAELSGPTLGRLPIDAKYKRYSGRRVSDNDLYQAFLYAYGIGSSASTRPCAWLVYPSETNDLEQQTLELTGPVDSTAVEIKTVALPIVRILDELAGRRSPDVVGKLVTQLALHLPAFVQSA